MSRSRWISTDTLYIYAFTSSPFEVSYSFLQISANEFLKRRRKRKFPGSLFFFWIYEIRVYSFCVFDLKLPFLSEFELILDFVFIFHLQFTKLGFTNSVYVSGFMFFFLSNSNVYYVAFYIRINECYCSISFYQNCFWFHIFMFDYGGEETKKLYFCYIHPCFRKKK